ncbi:hypothetical protein [Dolosigranulum savutiense]|uniref:Uncharacterized protein n=1 Tax=Dolosigranulum savutiense TaxID=3110288 RepID=A0AB74TVB3_9LACT
MRKVVSKLFVTCSCASVLSLAFPVGTVSAEEREIMQTIQHFEEEELYALLEAAETTPENYLQEGKEEQLIAHFRSYGVNLQIDGVNHSEVQERSVAKCVGHLTLLIGSTALGINMLKQLKNFVAAAGGIKAAASALVAVAKGGASAENLKTFGGALVDMASVVLGIDGVIEHCL